MDLYPKKKDGWSPYLAGALVGILAIASAWLTTVYLGKTSYLGASTTFVRAAGLVEEGLAPERTAENAYFSKTKIKVDWQFMLVLGILPGALIASLSDRSFKPYHHCGNAILAHLWPNGRWPPFAAVLWP